MKSLREVGAPRLIDRVEFAPRMVIARAANGKRYRLPGVGSHKERLACCPTRYILDPSAAMRCLGLAMDTPERLDIAELRLPAQCFWIEWTAEPPYAVERETRIGLLVETATDGRSGRITSFWETVDGRADLSIAAVSFNFDSPFFSSAVRRNSYRIAHGLHDRAASVLRHALLEIDPHWAAYLAANGSIAHARALRELAEWVWPHLPFVLAFASLLSSRSLESAGRAPPCASSQAGCERVPSGEIKVRLRLGANPAMGTVGRAHMIRAPCRLHHVRGHLVRRGEKIFWRAPHVRGDAERQILKRTVRVSV